MQSTISKNEIDLVIPGIEIDMYKWVEHIPEIKEVGALALLNNRELIQLCKDKWLFYNSINEFYKITGVPMLLNTSFN